MARAGGDVGGGVCVSGVAGATFRWARLAVVGDYIRAGDRAGDFAPERLLQASSNIDVRREWRNHVRYGCFAGFSDSRHSATSGPGRDAAARGDSSMVYQHPGIRAVVLEAGWRWAAESRNQARAH